MTITVDGTGRFSGEVELDINDGVRIFEDWSFVSEVVQVREAVDLEYEIISYLRDTKKIETLANGLYHIYFEGVIEFFHEDFYEGGTEYEAEIVVNYTGCYKLDKED